MIPKPSFRERSPRIGDQQTAIDKLEKKFTQLDTLIEKAGRAFVQSRRDKVRKKKSSCLQSSAQSKGKNSLSSAGTIFSRVQSMKSPELGELSIE